MTESATMSEVASEAHPAGLRSGSRLAIVVAMILAIVAVDQWSKSYAISNFRGEPPAIYFGGVLLLTYAENPGAFGGLVGNSGDSVRFYVLIVGCSVLLAGVAGYLFKAKDIDRPTYCALTLILAGGIGNLIDRVMHETKVIDFLFMQVGPLHTNIFNVADVAITGGFIILVVALIRDFIRPAQPTDP